VITDTRQPNTGSFYVTGGTLRLDAPCYVERQADRDLYEGLQRGEFCYVLTSRQMGKSSLMVRTAARLREEGVAVAVLDLTAIGQNLTVEQWYDGLLGRLGQQLDREEELEEFWLEHPRLGPLQRWMSALREVVLPGLMREASSVMREGPDSDASRGTHHASRLVIFIDEIDAVRSLPFSTDELFAGIRECYNRRTEDPEFVRLTFCLLGVATPSDLIQDTRTTPFNIGRRIELTDFTEAEAAPLAQGLTPPPTPPLPGEGGPSRSWGVGPSEALLQRVLYWTGGHPYLTQRLCQAVASETSDDRLQTTDSGQETVTRSSVWRLKPDVSIVDRLCESLFLSHGARERDDNLLFVRDRLLKSEADRASLLDLYGRVRARQRVLDEETNPLVSLLRLSGIVRVADGRLRVRNSIYERVFDRAWVVQHMPDAEQRRQRAAFRQGVARATAVAAVIVALVLGLAGTAMEQAHRADHQRQVAETQRLAARRNLYAAEMNLAYQAWDAGNVRYAVALLKAHSPQPGQEDLRGFEWRYLWRLCRQGDAPYTLRAHTGSVQSVSLSPNSRILASGGADGVVRLWDATTRQEIAALKGHKGWIGSVLFSPNGQTLTTMSGGDSTIRVWDVGSRRQIASRAHRNGIHSIAFSPDDKILAVSVDQTVTLSEIATGRKVASFRAPMRVHCLEFSPDGKTLAMGGDDASIRLWEVLTRREVARLLGHTSWVDCLAFAPNGRTLASGSIDSLVKLWDLARRSEIATLRGHAAPIACVGFSPDNKTLAAGSWDSTVRLWDVATRLERATFRGHTRPVTCLAFSRDGRTLVSGSDDQTLKLWPATAKPQPGSTMRHQTQVTSVAFSPSGKMLASGSLDKVVKLWDASTEQQLATLRGHQGSVWDEAFSPDGKFLASCSEDKTVRLWDVTTRQEVATLKGHTGRVTAVAFSPNGRILASGSWDDSVKLWEVPSWREIVTLPGYFGWHNGLAFSPDGRMLASGTPENSIALWDVAARRKLVSLRGHQSGLHSVAFSPDGRLLASVSFDSAMKLWDVARKREIDTVEGHSGAFWGVAFSPDGKTLATSSVDTTVKLWDVISRRQVATLKGHQSGVDGVAFSPDGHTLATTSVDTTVRLWRAASFAETDGQDGTHLHQSSR
jgi:WD40 repeat protein